MKIQNMLYFLIFPLMPVAGCSDDIAESEIVVESENPKNFTILRSGTLTKQSGTNTTGSFQIVRDQSDNYFIRLSENFNTKFSTGTVTVYLSTTANLRLNTENNFQLIGLVPGSGEHFFKLSTLPDAKFTHGVIWCGAAGIPFGNALLE